MKIGIIGLGYVGITAIAGLSKFGHKITGFEINTKKIDSLLKNTFPIVEPGVNQAIRDAKHKVAYQSQITPDCVNDMDLIMVCVGTPTDSEGFTNMEAMDSVIEDLATKVTSNIPIIIRSTVPVGTTLNYKKEFKNLNLYFHPEFLREGTALEDFFNPPKVIFGTNVDNHKYAENIAKDLYIEISENFFAMSYESAESVKYADNIFHALKVAFVNEFTSAAVKLGANAEAVMEAFRADRQLNISPAYLKPGFAYGGSCLEKDLISFSNQSPLNLPLFSSISKSNEMIINNFFNKIVTKGNTFIFNGLAFKEDIDDLRRSPFVSVILLLLESGKRVYAYDDNLKNLFGESKDLLERMLAYTNFSINQSISHFDEGSVVIKCHKKPHSMFPSNIIVDYDLWFGGDLKRVYE